MSNVEWKIRMGNGERGTGNGERGTGNGERGTGSFFIAPFYGKLQEITQCNLSVTLLNGSNKC